jgi:hypothetical protein
VYIYLCKYIADLEKEVNVCDVLNRDVCVCLG